MTRKISAHYVFPLVSPPIKFGIVILSDKGEILEVLDNQGIIKEIASLEFYDGILFPGFINCGTKTNQEQLEKLKQILNENPAFTLEDAIRITTMDVAVSLKCDDKYGSFEKHKYPGVNVISKVDLSSMKLTEDTQIRTLLASL